MLKSLSLLIVSFLLICFSALAENSDLKEFAPDSDPVIRYIINTSINHPNAFKDIDKKYGIVDSKISNVVYSIDLIMADFMKRALLNVENLKLDAAKAELLAVIKEKPLESFPQFYARLKHEALQNEKLLNSINKEPIIYYKSDGIARSENVLQLKWGYLKRLDRVNEINAYNQVALDPEGQKLLRYLARANLTHSPISRFTVSDLDIIKRSKLRAAIVAYRKDLFNKMVEQDIAHEKEFYSELYSDDPNLELFNRRRTENPQLGLFKLKSKSKKDIGLKVSLTKKGRKDKRALLTARLFNTLMGLPEKLKILGMFYMNIPGQKMKLNWEEGVPHFLLSPTLAYRYLEELVEYTQVVQFHQLSSLESAPYIQTIRKWVKKNKNHILDRARALAVEQPQLNIPLETLNYKKRGRPSWDWVIDHLETLITLFPDTPWEGHNKVRLASGETLDIEHGFLTRSALKIFRGIKSVFSIQAMVSTAGMVRVMATGNSTLRLLSALATRTLLFHWTRSKVYGKQFKEDLNEGFKDSMVVNLTLASGFIPGEAMAKAMAGTIYGLAQSAMSDRPLHIGMGVGAVFGYVGALLPPEATNYVVSGLDKNLENAAIEYLQNAVWVGAKGATIAYLDKGDTKQGLIEGLKHSVTETTFNIVVFGFRFDPEPYMTEQGLQDYLEYNNNILSERTHVKIHGNKSEALEYFVFRKDNLADKTFLERVMPSENSFNRGTTISMSEWEMADPAQLSQTLYHEVSHGFMLVKELGWARMATDVIWSDYKYGVNLFEDYEFCTGCTLPYKP